MVWAAISHRGKSEIAFLRGRQTSQLYSQTLENYLLSFASRFHGTNYIFMHDNATIHGSKVMKEWFERYAVELLDHPPLSPDLNPIENCCGMLSRLVYADSRQYQTTLELESSINANLKKIELRFLQKLVATMPTRLRDVL